MSQMLFFDGLISDHMVLQRRAPIIIRGRAQPGAPVEVVLSGRIGSTVATADGSWGITMPALEAGGPHVLSAASGGQRISVGDVLVGEVWICSGQSNMDWRLGDSRDGSAALAAAERHGDLRLLVMPRNWIPGGDPGLRASWQVGSRNSAAAFSAVGYEFGLRLRRELGIPVGLIDGARGGSLIHSWMPRSTLAGDALWAPQLRGYLDSLPRHAQLVAAHQDALATWSRTLPRPDPGIAVQAAGWAAPELEEAGWSEMRLPCWWQRGGHDASGVLWFRRTIEVPAAVAAAGATLHLGSCDKADCTWVNGHQVGSIPPENPDGWRTPRAYRLPSGVLRPGRNAIAVRVFSNIHQGGLTGPASVMRLESGDWSLPLSGLWRWRGNIRELENVLERALVLTDGSQIGLDDLPESVRRPAPDSPGILYESLVEPARHYSIAGVIWYQGESNEYGPEEYRRLFPAMIRGWRQAWGRDFPFLFVQLPNLGSEVPVQTLWAELREAQTAGLAEPATAMVPTIDIGDPNDLHPHNKAEVGRRLALAALAVAYGHDEPGLLAPLIDTVTADGGTLRLALHHAASGVRWNGGVLRGFEVAGADGRFVHAEAQADGFGVRVWSPRVPAPTQVRYAWADQPVADVCTPSGLPLAPFAARPAC